MKTFFFYTLFTLLLVLTLLGASIVFSFLLMDFSPKMIAPLTAGTGISVISFRKKIFTLFDKLFIKK